MDTSQKIAYDGQAIVSLTLAVAALLLLVVPAAAFVVAIAAIALALRSRQSLRENSTLAGATVSVLGFIIGLIALFCVAWPLVSSAVIQMVAALFR